MLQYKLVLATDLDGTFLEGSYETKSFFYNELLRLGEQVCLIYVTGRPVDTVKQFCKGGFLPNAHFVLGDHGTHVVDGMDFASIDHLQNPIIEKWNNGSQALKELLQYESGIELQPINPPYRVAYYYDPDDLKNETLEKIHQAGFDSVLSCNMYLDILPKGVNKGSTLLRLMSHLNLDPEIVVTSGDSLNDLSLFQTGLRSIAVSNSEPKLIEEIKQLDNVYHSEYPGILGIIDGLKFYKKFQLFQEAQEL